jgi:transcriptional regulator with XRE-family HTH domain
MKLKEIRNKKSLSVRQLSELSCVPIRTIEDLERRDDGRVSTAIKLADALCVTLDELCNNEPNDEAISELTQDDFQDQYPNFEIKCKICGSTKVYLQNTLGHSSTSGSWGYVSMVCSECRNETIIVDAE